MTPQKQLDDETVAQPTPAQLLELASRDYRYGGSREQAMRDELDMGATRFWQLVNQVIDDPPPNVALAWGPTINRLRRRREAGQRQRAPRRAG